MKIFLIAGGTASGKTTIAKKVWESVCKYKAVNLIQLDDYYYSFNQLKAIYGYENEAQINWDDPKTINFELLKEHLNLLEQGISVTKPKFVYEKNDYGKEMNHFTNFEFTIIEGIHALYDDEILERADLKIYVHADSDIRLIRRIRRDAEKRFQNFDASKFLELWEKQIKVMHNRYIEPKKYRADLIISTNSGIERKFNLRIIDMIKESVIE